MVFQGDLEDAAASHEDLPDADAVYDRGDEIPLSEVFDDTFIRNYTSFETFDELVAASPADAEEAGELERVNDGEWDEFIATETDFNDEEAFVMAGRDNWVAKRIGLE